MPKIFARYDSSDGKEFRTYSIVKATEAEAIEVFERREDELYMFRLDTSELAVAEAKAKAAKAAGLKLDGDTRAKLAHHHQTERYTRVWVGLEPRPERKKPLAVSTGSAKESEV